MIHNECKLHPPLPLLGLRPAQELDAALGVGLLPLHGSQGGHEHGAANDVEHGGVMILVAMVRFGEDVAQMSDQEDDRHLALGQEELLLGGPAFEEGLSGHAISYCSMLLVATVLLLRDNEHLFVWREKGHLFAFGLYLLRRVPRGSTSPNKSNNAGEDASSCDEVVGCTD